MKTKFLAILAIAFTVTAFGQRRELRSVEKSIKSGDFAAAKTQIKSMESMMGEMDEDDKEEYYFLKGKANLGAEDNTDAASIQAAIEAFDKSMSFNEADDYGEEAAQLKANAMNKVISLAVEDQNAERYDAAASKLYNLYTMSPKDTVYLYYAASNAVNGQDYENALKYYGKLKEMGYRGVETQYLATNKESGEQENFQSEQQRDLMVKAGSHIKPETKKTPPKSAEIAKNIALIYMSQDKNEEALEAMADARKENPNDDDLLKSQADIYLKLDMVEEYNTIMEEIIAKDPNNPQLYYNLGVGAANAGETEKAIEYYKKSLELDPENASTNLNIAATMLEKDKDFIDEMNSLGNSKADNKRYDELKNKRLELYKSAIPYLEKAIDGNPENIEAVRTLYNIHMQLGNQEQADKFKAKLDALEK